MKYLWLIPCFIAGIITGTRIYYFYAKLITKRLRARNNFLEKNPQVIIYDELHDFKKLEDSIKRGFGNVLNKVNKPFKRG